MKKVKIFNFPSLALFIEILYSNVVVMKKGAIYVSAVQNVTYSKYISTLFTLLRFCILSKVNITSEIEFWSSFCNVRKI